jgi:hypothetical protein
MISSGSHTSSFGSNPEVATPGREIQLSALDLLKEIESKLK